MYRERERESERVHTIGSSIRASMLNLSVDVSQTYRFQNKRRISVEGQQPLDLFRVAPW